VDDRNGISFRAPVEDGVDDGGDQGVQWGIPVAEKPLLEDVHR
jgi:hypothetical protein